MTTFREIRLFLGVPQAAMAKALEMTQGNVSFLERGQTVTPDVARKLISYAAELGVLLTYDHIYGAAPLPTPAAHPEIFLNNASPAADPAKDVS